MFIGNLFYRNRNNEYCELTIDVLFDKIKRMFGEDNLTRQDAENLIAVISFYVQHNHADGQMIDEEEIDELLLKFLTQKDEELYIGKRKFDRAFFDEYIKRFGVEISSVEQIIYNDLQNALLSLNRDVGLNHISEELLNTLVREIFSKYGIKSKKKKGITFPLDEIILIFSKYSPFTVGEYFKNIVNLYLYNNFLKNRELFELEEKNIIVPERLSPFQVDFMDFFYDGDRLKKEFELIKNFIFYDKKSYDAFDNENKLLFQNGKNDAAYKTIVYPDSFKKYEDNIFAFTFRKNEILSLFSFDDMLFPVYPSCYNIHINFDKLSEYDTMEQLDIVDQFIAALNKFYYKYSEYFYLVELLDKRNLYMKIYLDISSPNYNHMLVSYMKKILRNDKILMILENKNRFNYKKLLSYAKQGFLLEITIDEEEWNDNMYKLAKKAGVYLLKIRR